VVITVAFSCGWPIWTGSSVVEGERIVGKTKGGGRRTVTIDPLTVLVLQPHRAGRPRNGW